MDSQGMEALPSSCSLGFRSDSIHVSVWLEFWDLPFRFVLVLFFSRVLGGTEERTRCHWLCHERRHSSATVVRQAAAPSVTQQRAAGSGKQ